MAAFHDNWALAQEYITVIFGSTAVILLSVVLSMGPHSSRAVVWCTVIAMLLLVPGVVLAGVRLGRMHEENRAVLRL